jgi:hypothetical protein
MSFNAETKNGNLSLAGSQRSNTTMLLGIFIALLAVISIQANQVTTAPGFGPWMIGSGGEFTLVADAGVAANLAGTALTLSIRADMRTASRPFAWNAMKTSPPTPPTM